MVKRGRGFRHSRICFLLFNTLSGMGGLDETCISWRRFYSRTDLVVFLLLGMGGLLFNLDGIFASEKSSRKALGGGVYMYEYVPAFCVFWSVCLELWLSVYYRR